MAKVTSKLQVTVPKALAQEFGIRPGDEIDWIAAGDAIRVELVKRETLSHPDRVRLFDQATARQRRRQRGVPRARSPRGRGWTREELYAGARAR